MMARPIACILVLVLATACSTDGISEFIGTWRWEAGSTATIDCDNKHGNVIALSGPMILIAGTRSDLVDATEPDGVCMPLRLDVTGNIAAAQPGQSCTVETEMLTTITTFDDFALELDAAGTTLVPAGFASSTTTGAVDFRCVATIAGMLIRADRD